MSPTRFLRLLRGHAPRLPIFLLANLSCSGVSNLFALYCFEFYLQCNVLRNISSILRIQFPQGLRSFKSLSSSLAQDTALSRRRRGFESPWGRQIKKSHSVFFRVALFYLFITGIRSESSADLMSEERPGMAASARGGGPTQEPAGSG